MNLRGYLLDENLSPRLRLGFPKEWRGVHARELGDQSTDLALWEYARTERLVLVTKDADFTDMAPLQGQPPPWVVRLLCGNLRARDMRLFLEAHWQTVEARLPECGVINVYPDRVEGLILAAGP